MADPPTMPFNDWVVEYFRALLRLPTDKETVNQVNAITQVLKGLENGTLWDNHREARDELLKDVQDLFAQAGEKAGNGLGTVISSYYGVNAIGNSFGSIASGGGGADARKSAGDAIVKAIFDIFNLKGVASGFLNRDPGTEEQENFARFIGMNWQVQMADLIAGMASKWVPWDVTGGVREIGDKVQKILGLEDAQEEIMEPLMERLIILGLEKRFNRETLPVDLAPGDAIDAYIRGYIEEDVMNRILANEGIRNDIRPILVNLRAKNLTESDFRDLLERGIWGTDDVQKAFIESGYLEADALRKTTLLAQDRLWKLKEELLNCKEAQFASGTIDEQAFRSYLGTMNFSAEEEAVELEIARCKAASTGAAKPKKIAGSFNVAPWKVKEGASAVMTWNIRNADSISISGVGSVGPRGERTIHPTVSQTYVLTASNDLGDERFEAVVEVGGVAELKRPTATFSASPAKIKIGQPAELKWVTTNADSVSIDQYGPVGEAGAVAVFPFQSTVYTLRATNAAGSIVRQDIIFVELPDIEIPNDQRPKVALAVTPGVVTKKQPQTEVTWTLTGAENGTLTLPDGSSRGVGKNGAFVFVATATGIFTLRASNIFGETQNQQAIILKLSSDDEDDGDTGDDTPQISLSVSPTSASPGENVTATWAITGADAGTLILPDATNIAVGAEGSQIFSAPGVPGTYEVRVQASNANGPGSTSVQVRVSI